MVGLDSHAMHFPGRGVVHAHRHEGDGLTRNRRDEGRPARGILNVGEKCLFDAEPAWQRAQDAFAGLGVARALDQQLRPHGCLSPFRRHPKAPAMKERRGGLSASSCRATNAGVKLEGFIAVIVKRVGGAPTEMTVKVVGAALGVCRACQQPPAVPLGMQDGDNLFKKAPANTLVLKFVKQGQDNYFANLPVGEAIPHSATVCNTHDAGQGTRS